MIGLTSKNAVRYARQITLCLYSDSVKLAVFGLEVIHQGAVGKWFAGDHLHQFLCAVALTL